jgi:hypothetical protein
MMMMMMMMIIIIIIIICTFLSVGVGWDSVFSTATRYRLEGLGF